MAKEKITQNDPHRAELAAAIADAEAARKRLEIARTAAANAETHLYEAHGKLEELRKLAPRTGHLRTAYWNHWRRLVRTLRVVRLKFRRRLRDGRKRKLRMILSHGAGRIKLPSRQSLGGRLPLTVPAARLRRRRARLSDRRAMSASWLRTRKSQLRRLLISAPG
jgi:hypothetical protein